MRSFTAAVALFIQLCSLAHAQQANNESSSACPTDGGAHIIVARASLEPRGYGITGVVKNQVLDRVPGSTAEFVEYPATIQDYFNSETTGAIAARALINAFVENCPGAPLVVMGYSQGAQVTGDSLVGQQDHGFPVNSSISDSLPASTLSRVAAVIMMGDPTFSTDQTAFHVGNASTNSIFPRENTAAFETAGLASRTQSYCDADDFYCATGKSIAVHVGYVGEYGAAAADFVVNQIKNYSGASTGSGSGASASAVGTATRRPAASASASRSATRVSASASATASQAVPSASGVKSTGGVPSASAKPSSSATPSSAVSTGAASSLRGLDMATTGFGAVLMGLFAWML